MGEETYQELYGEIGGGTGGVPLWPRAEAAVLEFRAAGEGSPQCYFIRVLQVTAHGKSRRQAGDSSGATLNERPQFLRDIEGSSIPCGIGVSGHYYLLEFSLLHSAEELSHMQLVGSNAVYGGSGPTQDVVLTSVFSGALHEHYVCGFFDHTEGGILPPSVPADGAEFLLCQIETSGAEPDCLLDFYQCVRQGKGLFRC